MIPAPTRRAAYWITLFSILIPALICFWNVQVGVPLLLLGVYLSYRSIRMSRREPLNIREESPDEALRRSARIIRVQLVDDQGQDLPPEVAEKRLADAQARANPNDTVIGMHSVIREDQDSRPPSK